VSHPSQALHSPGQFIVLLQVLRINALATCGRIFPVPSQKQPDRHFRAGDKIRVNLYHGEIEDAVVRAVIEHSDGLKLQIDFGNDQTALIDVRQVVRN